tara:strand:+ start:1075 stop:1365 length:291 start_codon:yes stop_codon:yes gene_type:complete
MPKNCSVISNKIPEGSNKPAYIKALTYVGIAIGKINNHLKIFFPGKLYIVTNQAQDTPIMKVKNITQKTKNPVLYKYVFNKFSIKCSHISVDGTNR